MSAQDDDNRSRYTYSDAMNDWARQPKSFLKNAPGGILHPSGYGAWKAFGYLWRILVVLIAAGCVYLFLVKKYIKSEAFADMLAEGSTELLSANSSEFREFSWKGGEGICPGFSVKGTRESFFRTLEGNYLRLKIGLVDMLSSKWDLGTVEIEKLVVQLRSGGVGILLEPPTSEGEGGGSSEGVPNKETSAAGGYDPQLKVAGFGISPTFSKVSYDGFLIHDLDLFWGLSLHTRGRLTDTAATVQRDDAGRWTINASGGTLEQGIWRGLALTSDMAVTYGNGEIIFSDTTLKIPDGGSATLSGNIVTSDIPKIDLSILFEGLPLESLLPPGSPVAKLVRGKIDGEAVLGGSTNTQQGITSVVQAALKDGFIADLPIFNFFAVLTSASQFRRLQTEGTFTLSVDEGRVVVSEIELFSGDRIRIRGECAFAEGTFSGAVEVGLAGAFLERQTTFRDRYLKKGDHGLYWITVPLVGTLDELTREQSDDLSKGLRILNTPK